MPGGPDLNFRYVFDPLNPRAVLDMRHVLVVGKAGPIFGNLAEVGQLVIDSSSAFQRQDFYSNKIGYRFFNFIEGRLCNIDIATLN